MIVSVIIPTYKDIQALKLILDALKLQTYKKFEVIVAEDDNSNEVKDFLNIYISDFDLKHFSQEDKGWRKAKALNGALKLSSSEYCIFFDGDCIPYSTFVESHVTLSEKNKVLCGRRVNTGKELTTLLRTNDININDIENNYFKFWNRFKVDKARHIEQGLYLFPKSVFYKFIIKFLDKKKTLVGCNFSVYKSALFDINGFDEAYPSGDVADDVDVEWRLNQIGVMNKSCKFAANLIHLDHPRKDRQEAHDNNLVILERKKELHEYICNEGLKKLKIKNNTF